MRGYGRGGRAVADKATDPGADWGGDADVFVERIAEAVVRRIDERDKINLLADAVLQRLAERRAEMDVDASGAAPKGEPRGAPGEEQRGRGANMTGKDDERVAGDMGSDGRSAKNPKLTRREALRDAGVNAAVIALFGGAMTFEAVMAKAMGRVGEVRAIRALGAAAGDDVKPLDWCPPGYNCTTYYSCGTGSGVTVECFQDFTCAPDSGGTFGCTIRVFRCDNGFWCAPSGGTFDCKAVPADFFCLNAGFVCESTVRWS